MTKFSKSDIKRALLTARGGRFDVGESDRRRATKSEIAARSLTAKWMKQSGFDAKALEALKKKHRAEVDLAVAKQIAKDKKRTPRSAKLAHLAVASQVTAYQQFAGAGGFFPHPSFTLSVPDVILAEPNAGILVESTIARFASSAKIHIDKARSETDTLSFIYPWRNISSTDVVVDAVTFVSASGRLHLRQSGELSYSLGGARVIAQLEVLALDPLPTSIEADSRGLGGVAALSWPFWIDGTDDATFAEGLQLSTLNCTIPAGSRVFFIVSVSVVGNFDPGRLVADLSSGDFGIKSPLVVVAVRGQQPAAVLEM